jgi:hypothetical protein
MENLCERVCLFSTPSAQHRASSRRKQIAALELDDDDGGRHLMMMMIARRENSISKNTWKNGSYK